MKYFANLSAGRTVLWCYLIWYLFFATRYFDRSLNLWFTSLGISAIIGIALLISTWDAKARMKGWALFRLFLMPFCVSSFSALVKGRGFILIFSPRTQENAIALAICSGFCAFIAILTIARRGK